MWPFEVVHFLGNVTCTSLGIRHIQVTTYTLARRFLLYLKGSADSHRDIPSVGAELCGRHRPFERDVMQQRASSFVYYKTSALLINAHEHFPTGTEAQGPDLVTIFNWEGPAGGLHEVHERYPVANRRNELIAVKKDGAASVRGTEEVRELVVHSGQEA